MFSALKLVIFLALFGAVSSSEPVVVHEVEAIEMEQQMLELEIQEKVEAAQDKAEE